MCGITGYLGFTSNNQKEILDRMSQTLHSRGPDDFGSWYDVTNSIALGHRRLSIVDLSAAGHQPMSSPRGRYQLVYNGEIYNHVELRQQINSSGQIFNWNGHSDTETLLAGFEIWGVKETLEKCVGMFAIAVWDTKLRTLTLARDRIGEKPLYYGWQGEGEKAAFLFASELKAFKKHPSFENVIDRGSLSLYLRHNYVPAPYSIYKGISKLEPGTLLTVSLESRRPIYTTYWSGDLVAEAGKANPYQGSPSEAVGDLENLLNGSIKSQMMGDVPVGAFLSGGIDSSLIVSLMQSQSTRPVKTFTIGFNEAEFNEAEYAKAVAKHLKTDHTELYVSPEEALNVIPKLPTIYDEPFSDSSQIPTHLVSMLAKQSVTVSLSGDAGDELFCGYNRYNLTSKIWNRIAAFPKPIRKTAAVGLSSLSTESWDRIGKFLPKSNLSSNFGDKMHKAANVLASESTNALYLGLLSHWHDPASIVKNGFEPPTKLTAKSPALVGLNDIERMMALDMLNYLPDDILVKVDRAAMAVSLETRVPFLDHRVVEFAWKLPLSIKYANNQTKWPLREILYKYVPKSLIERPKMGFGVPLSDWLRGPLRDWAEALLNEKRLEDEGYFYPKPIRKKWQEHLSGQRNWSYHLWDILMFQSWLENNRTKD